jgi:hypothetical protein
MVGDELLPVISCVWFPFSPPFFAAAWARSCRASGLQLQVVIDHTANPGVEIQARLPTQALKPQ